MRDEKAGPWNGPAFYTIVEASLGLQARGQPSELMLLAMTYRGVAAILSFLGPVVIALPLALLGFVEESQRKARPT